MWTAILGAIGALVAWFALALLAQLVGGGLWVLSGPLRRPIWRTFVRARWPWPMFLLLPVGTGAVAVSVPLLLAGDAMWRRALGSILFVGGAFIAVASPLIWRNARRERASATRENEIETSRPAG